MATQRGAISGDIKETLVIGQTNQGLEIHAALIRLTRYQAVIEIYNAGLVLRLSEVLEEFKIVLRNRTIYSGPAVVRSLVNAGPKAICEVTLNQSGWRDAEFTAEIVKDARLKEEFGDFLQEWQWFYKVQPEFKIVVADLHTFLDSLRLWVEQIELGVSAAPPGDRQHLEQHLGDELGNSVFPCLDALFEKLENATAALGPEARPMHCAYVKRHLHPLILCSPFAFRSVHKPLGYAGDYEVVNMLLRDPDEGDSLYAKVLNRWFIKQPPAEAHRNRISYLTQKLAEETLRVSQRDRPARVFNLGCGPAREIQDFMAENALSDRADFTLLDFNEETLAHATAALQRARHLNHRCTRIQFQRKSVASVLKGRDKISENSVNDKYDFVYCAGLFDYLSDPVCRQLMNILYSLVAPGGLLLATNVDPSNPIQHWLGDVLDWHLIHRSGGQLRSLVPPRADPDGTRVVSDATGVNLFLEVRKPGA
jgi:extracellular factor (EF) 3-hydroxypalmitic acid methyl ester biosynthesis protein